MKAEELINLDAYPIHIKGDKRDAVLDKVRAELAKDGCAVLKNFLTPKAIAAITAEADNVHHCAHRSFNRTNPYFTKDDESLPVHDPRRRFFDRSNAFIPADNFLRENALRLIHDFPAFDPFIKDCLQEDKFFRYADPLADVIVNVAEEGEGFPWHFDTNNFTVTLAIQNAEGGGDFEYAPDIRTPKNENFEGVKSVLHGQRDKVRVLSLKTGDIQIFKGRYSLHRVTKTTGKEPRIIALPTYVTNPYLVNRPHHAEAFYGRSMPIHHERNLERLDDLTD